MWSWSFLSSLLMKFLQVMIVYITGHLNTVFPAEHRKEILRYIYCHQVKYHHFSTNRWFNFHNQINKYTNQIIMQKQNEDGGWGFHVEGHSTMFCTTLSYICMRVLGVGPDGGVNNACARARKWILDHGTVTAIPSWGKTWLSVWYIISKNERNPTVK